MIVEILGYFLSFPISHLSEFCGEGFGDRVKLRKTVLLESRHVHFSNLSWQRFFQAFGSRSIGSVVPWNRRQRKARHRASSPLSIISQGIRFASLYHAIQMPRTTRLPNSSYSCKQELTWLRNET